MQAILGIGVLLVLAWLCSENRSVVSWRLVLVGLLVQALLAGLFLYSSWLGALLIGISSFVNAIEKPRPLALYFSLVIWVGESFPFSL